MGADPRNVIAIPKDIYNGVMKLVKKFQKEEK